MSDRTRTTDAITDIPWNALHGSLLLFRVHSSESNGRIGAKHVVADVVVLDGPQANREFIAVTIVPKMVVAALRAKVGIYGLGRLGRGLVGTNWRLGRPNLQDVAAAEAWVQRTYPDSRPCQRRIRGV